MTEMMFISLDFMPTGNIKKIVSSRKWCCNNNRVLNNIIYGRAEEIMEKRLSHFKKRKSVNISGIVAIVKNR